MTEPKDVLAERKAVLDYGFQLLESALKPSHGEDSMSSVDIKLAILALRMIVTREREMIELLYMHPAIAPKKPWWKRMFDL